jgi:ABC-type nitrate/sulfonate/bicarbonate transport systems, periplasmic components
MQERRLISRIIISGCILLIILFLLFTCQVPQLLYPAGERPTVYMLYTSAGSMSQLLNTNQIDAFLIWEPVVANAELAGTGKRVAVPSDLPPPGEWANAASCVLVVRNDVAEQYPDISALLSALTTAAINRTNEDPDRARKITADWVFGDSPILTPGGSLEPLDVENLSFANMVFTAYAKPPESGLVTHVLDGKSNGSYDPDDMLNPVIMVRGEQFLNGSAVPETCGDVPALAFGYLPSSDNFAPLYVMVMDSLYFCNRYGFCLVPDDATTSRPVHCTLFVGETPAAYIDLIPGQSGGGIMTTVGQTALDGAFVGSVPSELQIALDNPSSIIQSINTGGSGLVVDNRAPCNDWDSFVRWVESRSAARRPVVVATVQSSIQEDMLRGALAYENITVKLYGTDFEKAYP